MNLTGIMTGRPPAWRAIQPEKQAMSAETVFSGAIRPNTGPACDEVRFLGRQPAPYVHPAESDLVHRLIVLGTNAKTRNQVGFRVSRYFSPDNQDHDTTYGDLLDATRRVAAGFKAQGLSGKRIAVAETNTLDFLATYYGGLAVGATLMPINLLAMQDENTKIARLTHMIAGPGSDAFVIGADPLFKPMLGMEKVLKLKNSFLKTTVQRFADGQPPRHVLDRVLYHALNKNLAAKASESIAKLKASGVTPTPAQMQAIHQQARQDFATLFNSLPQHLKLITPAARTKLARTAPMAIEAMQRHPDARQLAEIIFTSGTSGNPKGVALSHQNLAFTADSLTKAVEGLLKPDDVMLMGLPLFHIFGKAVMLTSVNRGTPVVLLPSLREAIANLDKVAKTIQDYKVTVLPGVPVFLDKLVAHAKRNPQTREAIKGLRVIISGGAPLKRSTYDALKAINPGLKILEGYGSSEAGINLLNQSGDYGFVGHSLPGVEVKLIESDKRHAMYGWTMWEGPGEILVRSPGVSPGYVAGTLPDVDPATVKDGLVPLVNADGWFHTGDHGRRIRSQDSQMQIMGRESNFIKDSGGERRDPTEFESAIRSAAGQISQTPLREVFAVSFRTSRETEKAVAVVITPDSKVTEQSLKQAMSELASQRQIAGALIPKHIVVLHQEAVPPGFLNDFKREAGYKAVKGFISVAVARDLLVLHDKTDDAPERTVVADQESLQALANSYQYR